VVRIFGSALGRRTRRTRCSGALRLTVFADDNAGRNDSPWRKLTELHLCLCGLLSRDRSLNAVEEALQPAHKLGLGDTKLCILWRLLIGEGKTDAFQLFDELRR
jgi:hypothetical protein